jgi:hypothetical protein
VRGTKPWWSPLRSDVRQFIDPTWDISFTCWDGSWWFDITSGTAHGTNGSFGEHLNEVACYVEEYLVDWPTWPSCGTHGRSLRIKPDGRQHILWACDSPPRHAVQGGHLAEIRGAGKRRSVAMPERIGDAEGWGVDSYASIESGGGRM